jgi:hypothetical protein
MILHRSASRETSENGVSSRVEACRKRLRLVRSNQKGQMETNEAHRVSDCDPKSPEVSPGTAVIETRAHMDEAGIR